MQPFAEHELIIESYPKPSGGGMQVPSMSAGVRVWHQPTGTEIIVQKSRRQYANKRLALAALQTVLESESFDPWNEDKAEDSDAV